MKPITVAVNFEYRAPFLENTPMAVLKRRVQHRRIVLSDTEVAMLGCELFRENVEALKSVQPEDLPATEIDVRLGASWLPPQDVQQFTQKLLNIQSGVEIGHIHALGM